MEDKQLIVLLDKEKSKLKETILKAADEFYQNTGLIITNVEFTMSNYMGAESIYDNAVLYIKE